MHWETVVVTRKLQSSDHDAEIRKIQHGSIDTNFQWTQSALPVSAGQSTRCCGGESMCVPHYGLWVWLPSKNTQSNKEKNMYIGVLNYKESKYHDRKGKRVPDNL